MAGFPSPRACVGSRHRGRSDFWIVGFGVFFVKIVIGRIWLEQMFANESLFHLAGDQAALWPPRHTEVCL